MRLLFAFLSGPVTKGGGNGVGVGMQGIRDEWNKHGAGNKHGAENKR